MPAKTAPTYEALAARMAVLQKALLKKKLTVAVAESCTGGLLGAILTSHGGSSAFFKGGAEVYSDEAKTILADVPPQLVASHGAVSSVVGGASRARRATRLGRRSPRHHRHRGRAAHAWQADRPHVRRDRQRQAQRGEEVRVEFRPRGNRLASVGAALDLSRSSS